MERRARGLETEYGLAMQVLRHVDSGSGSEDLWRPLGVDEAARHLFRPMTMKQATTNAFLRTGAGSTWMLDPTPSTPPPNATASATWSSTIGPVTGSLMTWPCARCG